MTTLNQEIIRLIKDNPTLLCSELKVKLKKLGWQIEESSTEFSKLSDNLPAWTILLNRNTSPGTSLEENEEKQFVPTGEFRHVKEVLSLKSIHFLRSVCDNYFTSSGMPPLHLLTLEDDIRVQVKDIAVNAARNTLKQIIAPQGSSTANHLVLLMNRCLLRRTYPPHLWHEGLCNANNQYWHQDSNAIYKQRPMLTLWIPLQTDSGVKCPGLEVSSVKAKYFSSKTGDNTKDHSIICKEHGEQRATSKLLLLNTGDAAVFNGLTYHQTAINNKMTVCRDALLLRVCNKDDAPYFPGDRNADITIN